MKALLVFLILIISSHLLIAQNSFVLKGFVHHQKEPLVNATIIVKNGNIKLLSDSTGYFTISHLQKEKLNLLITMVGYEALQQTIDVNKKDDTVYFELQPRGSSLNEVVVSGTMRPVQKLESPIAVVVYNPQHFKKNPSPSIFESLQMINGIRPQINCSVCNTGDIHINGLEGPYTMVTIDGMPIVSSLSSVYGLFGIPNQLIEKVEIIKGPASGLYGSEAIGGLINIITKDPAKAPLLTANIMSTSWLEHNIEAGLKFNAGSASSLIGINYFNYSKPFDKNGDLFTDVTLQERISVFNKWNLKRNNGRIATLAGRYFYEDRWGGDTRWNKTFRGGDSIYGESIYIKRWELIGKYQLPFAEKIFLSFSGTTHNQDSYYGTTPYMAKQNILFGQLTWNKTISTSQEALIGLAGRYNFYDDNSTATIDTLSKNNKPEKYFLPGIFLQDEWKLGLKHLILLGLRFDHHPVHKNIFTPRIAYKWSINDKQVFRLNSGTGFRVVNLFTEEHAALTGSRVVEVQEKLKPEKSYNVNLNFSQQLGSRSKHFNIDASAWYTYFQNQIIADYETDAAKIVYNNLNGYSVSKGVSVNVDFNFMQRFTGNLGITLQDVAKYEGNGDNKIKQRPMLTENFSGTWAISYSIPINGLSFDYTGNIYGPMRLPLISDLDPRKANSPLWSIHNFQTTKWLSNNLEIYAGVKNIFNWTPEKGNPFIIARSHDPFNKKVEYNVNGEVMSTPENPYALTFDPAYIYAPNQGIRVYAGVKFKLREIK